MNRNGRSSPVAASQTTYASASGEMRTTSSRNPCVGPIGSGTALTARTLYQRMFDMPLPASSAQYLANEEALAQLTVEKSIDVAVIVAGQPAKLFTEMKPEARRFIKLLRRDDAAVESGRARGTYQAATIRSASATGASASSAPPRHAAASREQWRTKR